MKLLPKDRRALLKAALGQIPNDLLLKNVRVVNVFTGEILPADVYVYDGFISHVEYDHPGEDLSAALKAVDGQGAYLTPGFIDAHVHIESSMLTPRNFARAVLPHGTTTIVHDPHEIGNVFGVKGVRYMHDIGADLPMRQLVDIPSCVPAVPKLENAGASFGAAEVEELAGLERVIGLAEIMDFLGVINGDSRMMDEIAAAEKRGLYLQAHGPGLSGRMLSAYLCGGPHSDHESRDGREALGKMRAGMKIDMRESSLSHNATEVWQSMKTVRFHDTLCMCTDDIESDDLYRQGSINNVIRTAAAAGMDAVLAIKSATINTAREIGMENLGAIAPGYAADMNLFEDLTGWEPKAVYYGGRKVAEDGHLTVTIPERHDPLEEVNSINIPALKEADLVLKAPVDNGRVRINVMTYDHETDAYTHLTQREVEVRNGRVVMDDPNLQYITVVNRYGLGTIGIGFVYHLGLKKGCLGTTVSHDSHNLTLIYSDPADALVTAEAIKEMHGGLAAAENGRILARLPLPIGGLLSRKTAEELSDEVTALKETDRQLGVTEEKNPLLRCAILSLTVAPDIRVSDLGMLDTNTQEFISPFVE